MSSIKEVLARNIEDNIAPVIYFHQLDPQIAEQEVREYVFTTRPSTQVHQVGGIHEQMVELLTNIYAAIEKGHKLPASWISGYFGSGKSSFAKLFGLALDGMILPDGTRMDAALMDRDDTPNADELRAAFARLQAEVSSMAVIFDIGTAAKNNESIPHTIYRQVLEKIGYSSHDGVAQFEIALEDEGRYGEFLRLYRRTVREELGREAQRRTRTPTVQGYLQEALSGTGRIAGDVHLRPAQSHHQQDGRESHARHGTQDPRARPYLLLWTRSRSTSAWTTTRCWTSSPSCPR